MSHFVGNFLRKQFTQLKALHFLTGEAGALPPTPRLPHAALEDECLVGTNKMKYLKGSDDLEDNGACVVSPETCLLVLLRWTFPACHHEV